MYAKSWYSYKLLKENKVAPAKHILDEIRPFFEQSQEKFLYDMYFIVAQLYEQMTGKRIIENKTVTEVLPYYQKNNNFDGLITCYDFLKQDAIQKKEYKMALFYTVKAGKISDSLYNKTIILKTKELDKKYQTQQKEQQIALQKIEIEQKNTSIALLIISLVSLLLVALVYYLWQKQKNLKQQKANSMSFTKQLLENTEDERKRIASDLHDSISHELLNLKFLFKQDFTIVNTKIDSIIDEVRGISRNLHPVMFDKIGLQPNIEQLVERLQIQNNFLVSTNITYGGTLSSASELQIYRIVQEALTNIVKYAQAYAAKITITEDHDTVAIEIKDNGKGFDVKQTINSGKAFGLHNIIERSRIIGGEAKIQSSDTGTIITIVILKKQ